MTDSVFERYRVARPRFDEFAWITARLRGASRLLQFILSDLRPPFHSSAGTALQLWLRGFTSRDALVYRLHERPAGPFISSFAQNVRGARINGNFDHVVNNKVVFPLLMKAAGLPAPRHLGTLGRAGLVWEDGRLCAASAEGIELALQRVAKVVIKPVKGCKGAGLLFLRRKGETVLANDQPIPRADLDLLLRRLGPAVVTEFIEQHSYARALYARTTNTIRLLTLWDYPSGGPFLAAAAQRIGNSRSYPADNFRAGRGGLSAEIDPAEGVLSRAAGLDGNRQVAWFNEHPESGVPIAGVQVPHWSEAVRSVLSGACALSFAPCLAWDMVMTEDSFSVIEINGGPGLHVHQIHRPLLENPRTLAFYRHHGIVNSI